MSQSCDQFEGVEAEYLKRLGAAILAIWSEIPDRVKTRLLAQTGLLKGGPPDVLGQMHEFVDRYEGNVE